MKDFQGKVAVVTGGASGLGRAMAQRFAREGMQIVLADVQQDALDRTVAEFTREGYSRRYVRIAGRWRDHARLALLVEDWRAHRRKCR